MRLRMRGRVHGDCELRQVQMYPAAHCQLHAKKVSLSLSLSFWLSVRHVLDNRMCVLECGLLLGFLAKVWATATRRSQCCCAGIVVPKTRINIYDSLSLACRVVSCLGLCLVLGG